MTRKVKIWLVALAALVLFAIAVWFLGTLLDLKGRDLSILRGGLWSLGIAATLGICWFLLRGGPTPLKAEAQAAAEVDAAMLAAKSRLRASRLGGAGALHALPVVLLLGPEGSAKTSTIVRSGLETEVLAGDVFRGETVAPTRILNLWYTRRGLLLEAGGRLTADAARWERLIHHLLPRRMRSAFWGRPQAARAALVCFSCEELVKGNAGDAVPAAARTLRARLGELATALGVRLPVYVVFTKADALPHFADYVRNFSREEVREVFGATFALGQMPADSGSDQVFKLVDRSFQRLFHSLASKRLKFLPRETTTEVAGSAYEFPREFRKVVGHATQFVVELARPNQLEISPFLRGFYFTGVRPVVVTEGVHEAAAPVGLGAESVPVGATSVFDPAGLRALANQRMSAEPTSRRVPQWVFLERLLPDVVLGDRAALATTERGSRRVDRLRRVAAAGLMAGSLAAIGVFALSYSGNRRLQQDVLDAQRGLAEVRAAPPGGAPPAALQRLDVAQAQLRRLTEYELGGPPRRLRWGLYSGSALVPGLRAGYFAAVERALVADVRDSLAMALRRLPDRPGQTGDYGQAYTSLKAYLITTARPDRSTPGFLAPVLLERWQGGRAGATRTDLARRQFAFYTAELPRGMPDTVPADDEAVARGRAFLRQFAAAEAVYRTMLSETSAGIPPVQFERLFPAAAPTVRDPYVVPGAFTKQGWSAMQAAFQNADRYLSGEDWVTGVRTAAAENRTGIVNQLRAMYAKDYIQHWRAFLRAASVARFSDVASGARVLAPLSGNQSPLLGLFSLVSRHTAVDSVAIAPAFQPVQLVTPPGDTTKYVGAGNESYVNALVALQASLEQIAKGGPDAASAASGQALNEALQAGQATKQLANKFKLDEEGGVHTVVQQLLETPLLDAQGSLQAVGPAQLNAQGRQFCAPFQRVLAKFPFNPSGSADAGLDEVTALFQPGSGALWSFVEGELGNYVARQGPFFAEKAGTAVRVSPSFLNFLNRAAEFSSSLYRPDGSGPAMLLTLRPILSDEVPSLTVNIDGQAARFTRSSVAAKRLSWVGAEAQVATLSGEVGGRERDILAFQGPWAIFRLFNTADWTSSDGSYSVRWRLPGITADGAPLMAVFDVSLAGAKAVFRRNFFSGVNCTGRITR